jgi:hypothetical protein
MFQLYSNYFDFVSVSVSGQKFADIRGGVSVIYSNRVVGATYDSSFGIFYREENPGDAGGDYRVIDSYVWENKHGSSGTTAMPINDNGVVNDGVDYFTSPLSPLVQLTYPHPWRGITSSSESQNPAVQATVGAGRARSVTISRP